MLHNFFEIFNVRFWILLAEIMYFPVGMIIGLIIVGIRSDREGGEEDG